MIGKAVHFGAGNIGRGFIGLLLAESGYEVAFVDVNEAVINEMNEKGRYRVILAGNEDQSVEVTGIRGILSSSEEKVIDAILEADVITTAVGVNILPIIAGSIAKGIEKRAAERPSDILNVMACENAVGNSDILKNAVIGKLSSKGLEYCEKHVGFPNTTVDRIVPEGAKEEKDILKVVVEPFYEWNVEKSKILGSFPEIKGMTLVDDLSAYIERKLFTLNTGHAITAYLGYDGKLNYIHEAIKVDDIRKIVLGAMREVGQALVKKHGFDPVQHEAYIQKILSRFENEALADPVARVGRDPIRKLGPKDRLIAPAKEALDHGIEPVNLVKGIVKAIGFANENDPKSVELSRMLETEGLGFILKKVCGLSEDERLFKMITDEFGKQ
ncbi:mannitol-1-phosphate 5-dehydrogenase [Alkalibacter mobilis]|uniref:mannitol-1-phosphate 5-dehydrogenase n=1 Tax=Alkalibacter mobilis TaxID=2787712 RepID=UPI00189F8A0D|nr:mannitol-1-phosphate 5-dehydrogenase [Alkalibacter mobilis]MBF7096042.1 mannitol-1-phosphate 5-dehydrogenase [Alkalibacter mobilis]